MGHGKFLVTGKVFSPFVEPTVGAPGLDFETWETQSLLVDERITRLLS